MGIFQAPLKTTTSFHFLSKSPYWKTVVVGCMGPLLYDLATTKPCGEDLHRQVVQGVWSQECPNEWGFFVSAKKVESFHVAEVESDLDALPKVLLLFELQSQNSASSWGAVIQQRVWLVQKRHLKAWPKNQCLANCFLQTSDLVLLNPIPSLSPHLLPFPTPFLVLKDCAYVCYCSRTHFLLYSS